MVRVTSRPLFSKSACDKFVSFLICTYCTCNHTWAPALLFSNNRLQKSSTDPRHLQLIELFIVSQLQDQILFTALLCTYTAGTHTHTHLCSSSSPLHSTGSSCHKIHRPLNILGVDLQGQAEANPPRRNDTSCNGKNNVGFWEKYRLWIILNMIKIKCFWNHLIIARW